MKRFFAAAQDAGGTGLEAQSGGVYCDIRARFIDDADDTHRHALFADFQAVRCDLHLGHFADWVGQGGDLPAAVRHAVNAVIAQCQAVNQAFV